MSNTVSNPVARSLSVANNNTNIPWDELAIVFDGTSDTVDIVFSTTKFPITAERVASGATVYAVLRVFNGQKISGSGVIAPYLNRVAALTTRLATCPDSEASNGDCTSWGAELTPLPIALVEGGTLRVGLGAGGGVAGVVTLGIGPVL